MIFVANDDKSTAIHLGILLILYSQFAMDVANKSIGNLYENINTEGNNDKKNNNYNNNEDTHIKIPKDGNTDILYVKQIVNQNIQKLNAVLNEIKERWNDGILSKVKLAYDIESNGKYKDDAIQYLQYISSQLKYVNKQFKQYRTEDGRSYNGPEYIAYLIEEIMGRDNTSEKLEEANTILVEFTEEFNNYITNNSMEQ